MILIRDMVLTTLKFNIFFTGRHLPGNLSERADLISRFQIERLIVIISGSFMLGSTVLAKPT